MAELRGEIRRRMSRHGAQIRTASEIGSAIDDAWHSLEEIEARGRIAHRGELPDAFRTRELALTHAVYLEAIGEYLAQGGKSRGSYLVRDPDGDQCCRTIGDDWRYSLADQEAFVSRHILELAVDARRARSRRNGSPCGRSRSSTAGLKMSGETIATEPFSRRPRRK